MQKIGCLNFIEHDIINNRYELIQELGSGGFGVVWLAKDLHLGVNFALKFLQPKNTLDQNHIELFKREFLAVRNIKHSHLLTATHFDVVEHHQVPFLVQPYCSGGSLYRFIENKESPTEEVLARMLIQIADGIAHLHSKGLIHRDIKPDNILIQHDKHFVLTDFGITSSARPSRNTLEIVSSYASPLYMAPECFTESSAETYASDIFSLGVTLFELCNHELPWGKQGSIQLLQGTQIPDLPSRYSAEFNALVRQCLSLEPIQRPSSQHLIKAARSYLETGKWNFGKSRISLDRKKLLFGGLTALATMVLIWILVQLTETGKPSLSLYDQGMNHFLNLRYDSALHYFGYSVNTEKIPMAYNMLARLYHYGEGTTQNYETARVLYDSALTLGDKRALYGKAHLMMNGNSVIKDEANAKVLMEEFYLTLDENLLKKEPYWRRIKAWINTQGLIPQANVQLGISEFIKAAESGDIVSYYYLGLHYSRKEKNDANAFKYFLLAADKGHVDSQNNVGLFLENGKGTVANPLRASEYYRLAADQNFTLAMVNLGDLYSKKGSSFYNLEQALYWYKKAERNKNLKAAFRIGFILDIEYDNFKEAMPYYRKAGDKGFALAIQSIKASGAKIRKLYLEGQLELYAIGDYLASYGLDDSEVLYFFGKLFYDDYKIIKKQGDYNPYGVTSNNYAKRYLTYASNMGNSKAKALLDRLN